MSPRKTRPAPSEGGHSVEKTRTAALGDSPEGRDERTGEMIGRYVLVRELGSGAHGVVYRGFDVVLERSVAIKLLRLSAPLQSPQGTRLVREGQAIAQVTHPNVVGVYDVGTDANSLFIAMELIAGETLRDWLTANRPVAEILDVFVQAGQGLAAAHSANVVHRDFKPDNVLVESSGRVVVGDFGLARALEGEALDTPTGAPTRSLGADLTATGTIMGTPAYMAPEQFRGGDIDARADQFAFCVALHEALCGVRPFAGDGYDELSNAISAGKRQPVPTGAVPAPVREALDRGLALNPADRFPSMDALVDVLRQIPTRKRRRRRAAAALLIATAAVAGVVALSNNDKDPLCQLTGPPEILSSAQVEALEAQFDAARAGSGERLFAHVDAWERSWQTARVGTCRATRVTGEQSDALMDRRMSCLNDQRRQLSSLLSALDETMSAETLYRAETALYELPPVVECEEAGLLDRPALPKAPARRAKVEALSAKLDDVAAEVQLGRYQRAADMLAEIIPEATVIEFPALLARAYYLDGLALQGAPDRGRAPKRLGEAVRLAAEAGDDDLAARAHIRWFRVVGLLDPKSNEQYVPFVQAAIARSNNPLTAATGHHALARFHYKNGNIEASVEQYDRAIARLAAPGCRETPTAGDVLVHAAQVRALNRQYQASDAEFAKGLAILQGHYGALHPKVAQARDRQGVALWRQGRQALALVELEKAVAIGEAISDPDLAAYVSDLAMVFLAQGRAAEALTHYERSLELVRGFSPPDPFAISTGLSGVGDCLFYLGRYKEARQQFQEALAIRRKTMKADHYLLTMAEVNMGRAQAALGEGENALVLCKGALPSWERAYGSGHPMLAHALVCIADAHQALGEPKQAIEPLERALELRATDETSAAERAEAELSLAKALWDSGISKDRAIELAQKAVRGFSEGGPMWQRNAREAITLFGASVQSAPQSMD